MNRKYTDADRWRCSVKRVFLKILQNSSGNIYPEKFFKKETSVKVLSCKFWEIFKFIYFEK